MEEIKMLQRMLQLRSEIKYSTLSVLSLVLVLVLHAIHWMLIPLMLGTMEMGAHHQMNMNSSSSDTLFTFIFMLVNGIAIFFACRLFWSSWRGMRKGRHVYKYFFISVVSIVISALSIAITG
jgi:hypothetical protein